MQMYKKNAEPATRCPKASGNGIDKRQDKTKSTKRIQAYNYK